jgi:ATP-binding cassette subfamily B protein
MTGALCPEQLAGTATMSLMRVYGRVLAMLAQNRRALVLLFAGNCGVAAMQFLDPLLFGRVIGLLSQSDTMPHEALFAQGGRLVCVWVAIGLAGILVNIAVAVGAERLAHRTRLGAISRCFDHVLHLPSSFHSSVQSGSVMKTLVSGSESLFALTLTFFKENLATYVAVVVLLPLSALLNWRLSMVLVALVAVFAGVTLFVIRRTQAGQRRAEIAHSQLAGRAQDALSNVVAVQSFGRLRAEAQAFGEIVENVIRHQFPVLNWWALVTVMTRASSTIAVITIVVAGALLHLHGKARVADIVSFMGFSTLLIGRLEAAVNFASSLFMRAPGIADYFDLLDRQSSVPERADAEDLVVSQGEVAFEQVGFAYPGGPAILSDVSFVARPGTVTALVGATGAGKSTAMHMLQRLWDPQTGGILIDGQDLRDVTLESLRNAIGVVFQESLLFNRTIRDNLLIGRPDATDADIERACRLAEAHDFIIRQPQGYDTLVGERGTTLSGGQRQRLAIARALLKDAPILILDEATSALDSATEARVSRAMAALMKGRTTFVIAHRLSTVRDADEILVFNGGQIAERGTFEGLLRQGGRFAELVENQLAGVS